MRNAFVGFWVVLTAMSLLQGCVATSEHTGFSEGNREFSIPGEWLSASVILAEWNTDLQFVVGDSGNQVLEKDTKWFKVNNIDHLEAQYISVYEHSHIERPIKISATAYYPDGSQWALLPEKIISQDIEFSDSIVHTFYVPKYQPDTVIKVDVERSYYRPEFTGYYPLLHEAPVLERNITLSCPEDVKLRNGIANKGSSSIEESFIVENGVRKKSIVANVMGDFREDERTPYPEQYYAGYYVSFPPHGKQSYSWEQLGDHYLKISESAFEHSPAIDELAVNIGDKSDPDNRIEQSFATIVQNIRYHLDSSNGFAFYPRKASVVLENGYGDCKELTTILKSVLGVKNISTHPVLLSIWGSYQPVEDYPQLAGFNHMILAAEKGDGALRFLDGTHSWADARSSYYDSVGRKGFILEKGNSRVVEITHADDFKNEVVTNSKVQEVDGEWRIIGEVQLLGYPALRFYEEIQETQRKDKSRLAGRYLQHGLAVFAEDVEIVELSSTKVVINYTAGFDESYVALGDGGIRLNTPSLFKIDVDHDLTDKLGPVFLPEYKQVDTWSLPFVPSGSELRDHVSTLADSSWEISGNNIKREYSQNESREASVKSNVRDWDNYLRALKNSVVWR